MNKKARRRLIVATVIIVAAFTVGLVWAVAKQGAYYRQVGDLVRQDLNGKNVKVGGKVLAGTIVHDTRGYHFTMQDLTGQSDATVHVDYDGQMPETFGPNVEVVVVGRYDAGAGTIAATELQTKCPSKYQAQAANQASPAPTAP